MLEKERADLLHGTPKLIVDEVLWKPEVGGRYRIEAKVLAPIVNEILYFRAYLGRTNYSFVLLFKNYPIRKFTKHQYHRVKRTGQRLRVPHKHIWNTATNDDEAYVPDDINPDDDINQQLLSFLEEENIRLHGGYQPLLLTGRS